MTATVSDDEKQFHLIAFADFIRWASREGRMIDDYEADTGKKVIKRTRSALERMIDEATGHDRQMAEDFIKWCAEVYGLDYLPEDDLTQIMKPRDTRPHPGLA